jgi:hypothetical protein
MGRGEGYTWKLPGLSGHFFCERKAALKNKAII